MKQSWLVAAAVVWFFACIAPLHAQDAQLVEIGEEAKGVCKEKEQYEVDQLSDQDLQDKITRLKELRMHAWQTQGTTFAVRNVTINLINSCERMYQGQLNGRNTKREMRQIMEQVERKMR